MVQSTTSTKQNAPGSLTASKYFSKLACFTEAEHARPNLIMQHKLINAISVISVEGSVLLLLTQYNVKQGLAF